MSFAGDSVQQHTADRWRVEDAPVTTDALLDAADCGAATPAVTVAVKTFVSPAHPLTERPAWSRCGWLSLTCAHDMIVHAGLNSAYDTTVKV